MLSVRHFSQADEGMGELLFALIAVEGAEVAGQSAALPTFHQHNRLADVREEELRILNQYFGGNEVVEEPTFRLFQFCIAREAGYLCHRHDFFYDAGKTECRQGVGEYDCDHRYEVVRL